MKAWVLHDSGDIRYEDVEKPIPKSDEVIVSVKAVGICGSDIPRIYRGGAYFYPLIPGHEFSGEIVEVGADVSDEWIGKRVGIFPLIPCKKCMQCFNKQYEMCLNYSYLGSRRNGGFAEFVAVPIWNLIELPGNVSYEQAAMLEPLSVAVHAVRKMDISDNDNVAVIGLGTIGTLILMLLKGQGINNIYAVGNKESQRKTVVQIGIDENNFCNSKDTDVDEWLKNKNIDAFFECVGKNETINITIDNAVPNGKIMLVGNPASDIEFSQSTYWKILRNQLTIKGTWNSSFIHDENDDWHYALKLIRENRINPENLITHKFLMSELDKGLRIMRDKSEEYIKIMLVN